MLDDTRSPFTQNLIWTGELQMISASGELFNHVDARLPMWAGSGDRSVRISTSFVAPFGAVPCVNLGLSGLDAAHDQNLRFRLEAVEVTRSGFVVEFVTWGDTHIARASVAWQAIGPSTGSHDAVQSN
ncbi:H-type lectin domain-containing protein [Paracoccus kondratievae]